MIFAVCLTLSSSGTSPSGISVPGSLPMAAPIYVASNNNKPYQETRLVVNSYTRSRHCYAVRMARGAKKPQRPPLYEAEAIDANRVVSFNLRAAREEQGLTQEQFADRLEAVTGHRPTQASVSALERAWEGGRRREFDAQELVDFAVALNVPIVWFFLPPPGDVREIQNTGRHLRALVELLVGRADQLPRIEERLREIGLRDPTAVEQTSQMLLGQPAAMGAQAVRELREVMLAQILHEMADDLDESVKLWKTFFDRLDKTTVRGLIAERTNNDGFLHRESDLPGHTQDSASLTGTGDAHATEDSHEYDAAATAGVDDVVASAAPARQA